MNLATPIQQSCLEVFPMFGVMPEYLCEEEQATLNSANSVNILIGMSNGLKGNLVVGMSTDSALCLVSKIMGGAAVTNFDTMVKSALGELTNMLTGNVFSKVRCESVIDLSSPTIILGEEVFLMISNVSSRRITFAFDDHQFTIAYSIE